jgi:hypothetical protein
VNWKLYHLASSSFVAGCATFDGGSLVWRGEPLGFLQLGIAAMFMLSAFIYARQISRVCARNEETPCEPSPPSSSSP